MQPTSIALFQCREILERDGRGWGVKFTTHLDTRQLGFGDLFPTVYVDRSCNLCPRQDKPLQQAGREMTA